MNMTIVLALIIAGSAIYGLKKALARFILRKASGVLSNVEQ